MQRLGLRPVRKRVYIPTVRVAVGSPHPRNGTDLNSLAHPCQIDPPVRTARFLYASLGAKGPPTLWYVGNVDGLNITLPVSLKLLRCLANLVLASPSCEGATVPSLGASAPGPGGTSRKPLPAPEGDTSGRALLSPRLGLGTGNRWGRLGTSWG